MGFLSKKVIANRREFIDYIHGLVRHEIHNKENNDKRLEVLSSIYNDLLYLEDLTKSEAWYSKSKGQDELGQALDKLSLVANERDNYKKEIKEILEYIDNNRTKKDIIDFIDKKRKTMQL